MVLGGGDDLTSTRATGGGKLREQVAGRQYGDAMTPTTDRALRAQRDRQEARQEGSETAQERR